MNCADTKRLIHAYLDGELDAATDFALAKHINACPRCGAELECRRATSRLVKTAMRAEPVAARDRRMLRESIRAAGNRATTPMLRRRILWLGAPTLAAVALLAWMLVPLLNGVGQRGFERAERYVYHINNSENAATALLNIGFHLEAAPKARFVVVTHNEGVDFLLRGAKDRAGTPLEPRIAALVERGVQFRVCLNTLKLRGITPAQVVAQAQFVPSGIAEVGRLQVEEGFAYLKP
jgi:intracellular sulfur oxidation DsrE/DsrF family protein